MKRNIFARRAGQEIQCFARRAKSVDMCDQFAMRLQQCRLVGVERTSGLRASRSGDVKGFGRRPRYKPNRRDGPSSETLRKSRSSSLFSKAVVLACPRLIDRLDVIGGDKLDDVLSTAANKKRYECS